VAQNPLFEHGSQVFSYMLSLNALTVLVVQFPIVRVASKFPPVVPLILGNVLVATSLFLFGIATSVTLLMISVILFTIGEVLMFTMMDVLIDRIAKPEWKGTYFGTIGFNNLGSVMAPILGGLLLTQFGTGNGLFVFVPLALTTALGLPFLIVAHKRLVVREREVNV
jgi:MFS family permease